MPNALQAMNYIQQKTHSKVDYTYTSTGSSHMPAWSATLLFTPYRLNPCTQGYEPFIPEKRTTPKHWQVIGESSVNKNSYTRLYLVNLLQMY